MKEAEIIFVILTGLFGGLLNSLLLERGFTWPYSEQLNSHKKRWNPGFISNLALGIGASVIVYGISAENLPFWKMISVCLLAGIGGGNLITTMLQKNEINLAETKINVMQENLRELIGRR